jgi:TonB family protein
MKSSVTERPAAAAAAPARSRRTELFLLSSDDELLLELGPLLGERYRVRTIDELAELPSESANSCLLVLDATRREDALPLAAQIGEQHPSAALIVLIRPDAEAQWFALVTRGAVCATVPRADLANGSFSEALQRAEARLADQAASQRKASKPPRKFSPVLLAIPVLLAAAGALTWKLWPQQSTPAAVGATNTAAGPVAAAPERARSPLELLSAARVAFREQKNLLPRQDSDQRGESVMELYLEVLRQDAANDEAQDGLRRLLPLVRQRVQADIAAAHLDDAAHVLALYKASNLEPEAVHAMEADLAAARPRVLVGEAHAAINAGDAATAEQLISQLTAIGQDHAAQELRDALNAHHSEMELSELTTQVRAAISSGALLDPSNDNARTRLQALRQAGAKNPLLISVQRELVAALLAHATDSERTQQWDAAQRYLTAAADYGNTQELSDAKHQLQTQIDQATQRAAAATAAAAAAAAAQAAAPPASNSASGPAAPAFIAAKSTKPLTVDYPRDALKNKINGYVIVEFLLGPKGTASELTVVESSPPKTFDDAALDAVSHGHFDTQALGAAQKPVRARIRISFKAPNT